MLLPIFIWRGAALFFAKHYFGRSYAQIIQEQRIFVGGGHGARTRRAAQQAYTFGRLKNIGEKRAAVRVKFNFNVAAVAYPYHLIAGPDGDYLRNDSDQYVLFRHCF